MNYTQFFICLRFMAFFFVSISMIGLSYLMVGLAYGAIYDQTPDHEGPMHTINKFYFPDGSVVEAINTSECNAQFSLGEQIVIEGEGVFTVQTIKNKFVRDGNSLKMTEREVTLED